MYNAKFGKLRYGLKNGATKVVKISAALDEQLWNITGFGDSIRISNELHERVLTSFTIRNAVLVTDELTIELSNKSSLNTCYSISAELNENIGGSAKLNKYIFIVCDLHEKVNSNLYLGKNIQFILELNESVLGDLELGKNIPIDIFVAEQVNADIAANVLEKQVARVEVTIPPGGELRIDSSVFNATMNGENILHLYSGDWIMISRNTTVLTVQTATGGVLKGQLLYKERYL